MRCCKGVLLSRFCIFGHPPWTRAVSHCRAHSGWVLRLLRGHYRSCQSIAMCPTAGCPASKSLHTSVAVSSCLLLLRGKKKKTNTSVPHRINCEQLQCTSPSAYQLCLLKAREKNYNSKLYCQQRNNNSFKRSQCFSSVLIVLLTKYAV